MALIDFDDKDLPQKLMNELIQMVELRSSNAALADLEHGDFLINHLHPLAYIYLIPSLPQQVAFICLFGSRMLVQSHKLCKRYTHSAGTLAMDII